MKTGEFIRNIAVPFVTALTGLLVVFLNYSVTTNEQQSKDRFDRLDLQIKQSSEKRAQRESSQDFNLKIYEIVAKSLEEGSPQKQQAATAFIVVMVDEPLRSSLLGVLQQGAETPVKAEIRQILQEEEKFKGKVAIIPQKRKEVAASYDWGEWAFDIFWCVASGQPAKNLATIIGEELIAENAKGRIRVRELPESINARPGYQIDGFVILRDAHEQVPAEALKNLAERALAESGRPVTFTLERGRDTSWYISAFVCPQS